MPRSGSSLLCRALRDTGLTGQPEEYFNPHIFSTLMTRWGTVSRCEAVVRRLIRTGRRPRRLNQRLLNRYVKDLFRHRTSSNGVFGAKTHFHQLTRHVGDFPLESLFPKVKYISVVRNDRVRQAISCWRSLVTGIWNSEECISVPSVSYSFGDIHRLHCRIIEEEYGWEKYYERYGIQPMRLTYETIVGSYNTSVAQVLKHLRIQIPSQFTPPPPAFRRLADANTEELVEKYLSDLHRFGIRADCEASRLTAA